MAQYPAQTNALLGVIARRIDAATQMRLLADMPAGSAIEALVHLSLLAQGAEIVLVAPEAIGNLAA